MTTSPPSFMMLPPEIRTMVYKALFDGTDAFGMLRCLFPGSIEHPAQEVLSLLMTSPHSREEVLRLSLPEVRLCVAGQRTQRDWDAECIEDAAKKFISLDIVWDDVSRTWLYPQIRPIFLQSRKMTAWNGDLLLKSLDVLTLTIRLGGPFTLSIGICFDSQRGVEISLLSSLTGKELSCDYIAIKDVNDAAIAKLKTKTLRRLGTFESFSIKLVEGIAGDLRRVGWHCYPQIRMTNGSRETVQTWHISVPGTSAPEEREFRKAEEDMTSL